MIEVGCITIIENKEEFLAEYNKELRRFQHAMVEDDFDIETEPLPVALKYVSPFDTHCCGNLYRLDLEEAKKYIEERLLGRIEDSVNLLKRIQKI